MISAAVAAPKTITHTSATRKVELRSVLLRSTKAKPDAAHRMDQGLMPGFVQLATESSHIDVDDIGHGIEMHVPHIGQQHRARDDPSLVADEIFQELEFARQQLDIDAAATRAALEQIHFQIPDP